MELTHKSINKNKNTNINIKHKTNALNWKWNRTTPDW